VGYGGCDPELAQARQDTSEVRASAAQTRAAPTRDSSASFGTPSLHREREFFSVNLLVRIHLIIEMILVDRTCTMGV